MNKFWSKLSSFARGEKMTGSAITALVIGVIIAVNAVVYAITAGFGLYLYSPEVDDLTISGATDALFEDAIREAEKTGDKVTIILCKSKSSFDPSSSTFADDEVNKFYITAKQFEERYPSFIQLAYLNIVTRRMTVGDSDEEILVRDISKYQLTDESGELYPLYNSTVIFESKTQHKTISDIASSAFMLDYTAGDGSYQSYNGEEIIASMVSWVLTDDHKMAYFTTHHGETSDISFANMLTCAGYSIEMLDLRQCETIPEDADLVVISNPNKDFERSAEGSSVFSEEQKLIRYIEEGGNLYVALDPYVDKLHVLESVLEKYGIAFSETERDGELYRNIVKDTDNAITADNFTLVTEFADNEVANSIAGKVATLSDSSVIIRECSALNLSGSAAPLLVSSGASSLYAGGEKVDNAGDYCVGAHARIDTDKGEVANIFVIPSIYMTANDALSKSGYANRDFIYAMLDNLFGAESVPYGCTPVFRYDQTLENLTMSAARLYTVLVLSIPVAIAIVGSVVIIKRKNR